MKPGWKQILSISWSFLWRLWISAGLLGIVIGFPIYVALGEMGWSEAEQKAFQDLFRAFSPWLAIPLVFYWLSRKPWRATSFRFTDKD